ncbi:MAG: polysaccharide biosynthesis protein [Chitinophagia bacterium]|nr:polysaccharide biosynthesis protein [Chitinophagia bacterium]
MSGIKKLAQQTIWYGLSSMAARLINYLLTPYLTYKFTTAQYGEMSIIYSFIPFMNVLFSYGMETAYFRFSQSEDSRSVQHTAATSLILSTLILSALLFAITGPITQLLKIAEHREYFYLCIGIIATDAITIIPFAKLRQDGRPIRFAAIKIGGILCNIAMIYFLLSYGPNWVKTHPGNFSENYFSPGWAVGYALVANLCQNLLILLLLKKEIAGFQWKIDKSLLSKMLQYALPLIIVGMAGMVNETFDRIMLGWWAPVNGVESAKAEVGIYSACYKLSILITLGVQAFRMGAEPFFFKLSSQEDAPHHYARVMKFFVITLCGMYLIVMLYIDIWKHFIQNKAMWVGLHIVPVLLLANICLGIYYNLSIWYKLGNRTMAGAWITVAGALITLSINYWGIPHFSYVASAWATLACYSSMMVISYVWGQKVYPVPYAVNRLLGYIAMALLLGKANEWLTLSIELPAFIHLLKSTAFLIIFLGTLYTFERTELKKLPLIGKWIR